jgi:hypothetical protein
MKDYGVLLVSDGGGVFRAIQARSPFRSVKRWLRYTTVAQHGVGAMRKRYIVQRFRDQKLRGAFWGIATKGWGSDTPTGFYPPEVIEHWITRIRTDLDRFDAAEGAVLQNHGYLEMDGAARSWLRHDPLLLAGPIPTTTPPFPTYLPPAAVTGALGRHGLRRGSHHRRVFGRYRPLRSRVVPVIQRSLRSIGAIGSSIRNGWRRIHPRNQG